MKIFIIMLLTISFASQAELVTNSGETFPESYDVSDQFRDEVPIQEAGFCHIYAAIALVEAACYRATGKRVDLSEAYLINRHLSVGLSKMENYAEEQIIGNDSLAGGMPENTVKRIMNCSVCTEYELPMDYEFLRDLDDIASKLKEQYTEAATAEFQEQKEELYQEYADPVDQLFTELKEYEQALETLEASKDQNNDQRLVDRALGFISDLKEKRRLRKIIDETRDNYNALYSELGTKIKELNTLRFQAQHKYTEMIPELVTEQLENQISFNFQNFYQAQGGGLYTSTQDPDLLDCLQNHANKVTVRKDYSQKLALELLTKGIPFLCTAKVRYSKSGTDGWHAFNVVGYEWSEITQKVEMIIRDSNSRRPLRTDNLGCAQIIVIETD